MYPVRRGDILWVKAEGNYAQLHLAGRHFLVRETMTKLESRLGRQFARIHRSVIVNLDAIAELQPWFGGDMVLILTTGARLRVSRHFKERLDRWALG